MTSFSDAKRDTNHPIVSRLLAALPERMSGAGAKTLRQIITQVIPSLTLALTESDIIQGFDDHVWQRLWSALLQAGPSHGTRRRYKKLLVEAAEAWKAADLVESLPDLDVPPQHHRRLTVHVRRLKGYRFSDYKKLVQVYINELTGKGTTLVPNGLQEEPTAWIALGLILGGVCVSGVISNLITWQWSDVPRDLEMPLRRPYRKRQSFIWQALPPLPRLLLLTYFFRGKLPSLETAIFRVPSRQLGQKVRHLLSAIADAAGVAAVHPKQLTEFVRLDLRQALPDLHLALLCGQVKSPTAPADQVIALLQELRCDSKEGAYDQPGNNGPRPSGVPTVAPKGISLSPQRKSRDTTNYCSEPDEHDLLLGEYERLLKDIAQLLRAIWQPRPPKRSLSALERWARAAPLTIRLPGDVPHFNIGWLVRWLINMVHDRKLKWRARTRYWSAALQIIYASPAYPLHELNQAILEDIDAHALGAVTRAAFKRLMGFLKHSGIEVPAINWRALSRPRAWQPVRVLTSADQRELLNELRGTPLGRAAFLARYAMLRESEVCHLQGDDLDTTGQPYLVVWRSKRGRSRRITLDQFSSAELRQLSKHRDKQTDADRPNFVTAENGEPLQPKKISEEMRTAFEAAGLRSNSLTGRPLRFHDWRAAGADALYRQTGDLRYVALQMGHMLITTTIENYLRTLDLQAIVKMQQWKSPINSTEVYLPLATLAALLDREPERVSQMVSEFNAAQPEAQIQLRKADQLPDGPRPGSRTGKPANYIQVSDALQLVIWLIHKPRRGGKRSQADEN